MPGPGASVSVFAGFGADADLAISANDVHYNEWNIVGASSCRLDGFHAVAPMVSNGQLPVAELIGTRLPLDRAVEALALAGSGADMRVGVDPGPDPPVKLTHPPARSSTQMSTNFTPAFDVNPAGTTAALGRNLRLRGLFGADGRTLTVALDQAVPAVSHPGWPPSARPSRASPTVSPMLSPSPKGLAGPLLGGNRAPLPWILKASMFSVEFHPTYDATIATVQDAVRLGADAVAVGISGRLVQPGRDVRDAQPGGGGGPHLGNAGRVPRLPVG